MRIIIRNTLIILACLAVITYLVALFCVRSDGDANRDGRVNAADLTMMKRHIVGTCDMSIWQVARCDMNGNGRVDELDLTAVKYRILQEVINAR